MELLKNIDTLSLYGLALIVMENLLFGVSHLNLNEKKQNTNSPYLSLNFLSVPEPYLPFNSSEEYTLILDMDETLIHYFLVF